jgi:hypothetical protein
MTMLKIISERRFATRVAAALLGGTFILGSFAPAFAEDHRGDRREWHDWHHDRGYYRAPPVVYGGPAYYAPPVVFGAPGFGLNINIR